MKNYKQILNLLEANENFRVQIVIDNLTPEEGNVSVSFVDLQYNDLFLEVFSSHYTPLNKTLVLSEIEYDTLFSDLPRELSLSFRMVLTNQQSIKFMKRFINRSISQ